MKIKDVSKKYNISADTLRYWERVGALPPVTRDSTGNRDYDEEDQDWIQYTKCMRDIGISIERIIEYLALFKQGDHTISNRKELLIEQKEDLREKIEILQKTYDMLGHKVDNYEELMLSYEGKLRTHDNKK
jgi:MerR family transcriptional regulator, aldehyde-responsive regulator